MASDDYLTLPLHERITLLRKRAGSHDRLAAELGTTRQTVIGWEKGAEPNQRYRSALSRYSGWPEAAFRRTTSELEVQRSMADRLAELEAEVAELRRLIGPFRRNPAHRRRSGAS